MFIPNRTYVFDISESEKEILLRLIPEGMHYELLSTNRFYTHVDGQERRYRFSTTQDNLEDILTSVEEIPSRIITYEALRSHLRRILKRKL